MGGAIDCGGGRVYGDARFVYCEYQFADDSTLFWRAIEWCGGMGDYRLLGGCCWRAANNGATGGYAGAQANLGHGPHYFHGWFRYLWCCPLARFADRGTRSARVGWCLDYGD